MLTRWEYRMPSIWNEMSRLSQEFERLAGSANEIIRNGVFPPINIYEEGDNVVVRAELPGVNPDDLEINATANSLNLKGVRKPFEAGKNASVHRRERGHGSFSRTVTLPQQINAAKVTANYKLGVLEVVLPLAEESRPQKIKINA